MFLHKFWQKPAYTIERDENGRRIYIQMAVSPEAHRRIVERANKSGDSLVDTVDKIMGVI